MSNVTPYPVSCLPPVPDDVLRAAVTRAYWPGLPIVQAAPLAVLVPLLRRVEAAW